MVSRPMPRRRTPSRSRTIRSYLMFWPVFRTFGVLEDGAKDVQGAVLGDLGRGAQVIVPDRDVERFAGDEGEGQPDQPGPRRGRGGRSRCPGPPRRPRRCGRPGPGAPARRGRSGSPGRPGGQASGNPRAARRTRARRRDGWSPSSSGSRDDEAVEVELERQVAAHGDEPAAELEQLPVLVDLLPDAGVLDLVEPAEQGVERAELLDERLGRLLADAGDAGNVVRGVAPQGQDVDDPVGLDAEELPDAPARRWSAPWTGSRRRSSRRRSGGGPCRS